MAENKDLIRLLFPSKNMTQEEEGRGEALQQKLKVLVFVHSRR